MTISVGEQIPNATLSKMVDGQPTPVELASLTKGRKVVIFGLPGAFTGTCSTSHLPSFMRTSTGFKDKGVDEIICISVNDAWVMEAWDHDTGAGEAGVTLLADHAGELTKALGFAFDVPAIGFFGRSQRFALVAEDAERAIEKAIEAGVDMFIFSNNSPKDYDPEIIPKAITIIKKLIVDGKITEERIEESYQRIMLLKEKL